MVVCTSYEIYYAIYPKDSFYLDFLLPQAKTPNAAASAMPLS